MTTVCRRRARSTWPACTCPVCLVDRRRLAKHARAGIFPSRPSTAAWERIDEWLAAGWTSAAIASASGLPERTIRGALEKHSTWTRGSALAILSAGPPTAGYIGVTGTRRRLRALAALGHPEQAIADAAAMPTMTISAARRDDRVRVHVTTAAAVQRAYAALAMVPGTNPAVRAHAVALGWVPPLAWDDETIDDPCAQPELPPSREQEADEVTVARLLAGQCCTTTTVDREAAVPLLAARGLTDQQIATLCRTTDRTIFRTRQRLGIASRWAA